MVYWDGDDRKDLLAGLADGRIRIYLNTNTNDDPLFDGGEFLQVGPPGLKTDLSVGARATPKIVDWNNDGRKDLVVGALDGRIHIFLNEGTDVAPEFVAVTFAQEDGADLAVPLQRSSPHIADLNRDGKKDLLTGNTAGELFIYSNVGTDDAPEFSGFTMVQSLGGPIDLPDSARSRPFVCDWTGDGQWDVLVGGGDGLVRLYQQDDILLSTDGPDVSIDWVAVEGVLYDVLYATSPDQNPFNSLALGTTPPAYHAGAANDGVRYCYRVLVAE